jgi:mRNA N6-methyladenine demethylase
MKRQIDQSSGKNKKIKYVQENILNYVTPQDKQFKKILKEKYNGLEFLSQEDFETKESEIYKEFNRLLINKTIRHYHIVIDDQLVIPTIQRALLGVKGMTYKYFNIRMFAIPWEDTVFEKLNNELSLKSSTLNLEKFNYDKGTDFNISLLNFYDPQKVMLKRDDYHGIDEGMSVKWHRDTFLEPKSTVAVYQSTEDKNDSSWYLGFRIAWDIETPALFMNVDSSESYFMLYEFNETHQHAIFTGDSKRFTSTHRKIPEEGNSIEYILNKCGKTVEKSLKKQLNEEYIQDLFDLSNEIEFDWIRQFWFQGYEYSQVHHYWIPLMKKLEDYWGQIQEIIKRVSEEMSSNEILKKNLENKRNLTQKWKYWISLMYSRSIKPELLPIETPKFD